MRRSARGRIKAYRAAGRMFGQTFHSGRALNESALSREHTCAMREVAEWFAGRHKTGDRAHAGECIREAIERLRCVRARIATRADP